MSRDLITYLEDIKLACTKIQKYATGMTFNQFLEDDRTIDAITRNSEIIGEAAKKLPEDLDLSSDNIESQHIGSLLDNLLDGTYKISFKVRIAWIWRNVKGSYHDIRYKIRNRYVWRNTLNELRPWEGFSGLLFVMQTHLRDYCETEGKYGCCAEEERSRNIASVKETLDILERMKYPDEYYSRLKADVDSRYPSYKTLVTHYKNGGMGSSGDFVAQGNGWTGREAGRNPREGYFEFIGGKFELAESPDQTETDRLLMDLSQYYKDTEAAYRQAEAESDADFARLAELLRGNLYSWWD